MINENYQAFFDVVLSHMRIQKSRSVNIHGFPSYRGNFDFKCSIGCLIPDEALSKTEWEEINSYSIYDLLFKYPHIEGFLPERLFCSLLQDIHDSMIDIYDFEKKMCNLAEFYQLNYK